MTTQPQQRYRLEPWRDLQPQLEGLEIGALTLGPDGAIYILASVPPGDPPPGRSRDGFARGSPHAPKTFVVLRCADDAVTRVDIHGQRLIFRYVQPLPHDELLLVAPRSRSRGPRGSDPNGYVFNLAGVFQRSLRLGDGIQDVQTTLDGRIWVSYFDEGVFGDDPMGESGLICLDHAGNTLYEYNPPSGLDRICDCYALNVAGERDCWCCYYTEFPLVHIHDQRAGAAWACPIRGSNGFAFHDDMVLMAGGYEDRDTYHLLALQPNGQLRELRRYGFVDENGQPLAGGRAALRGHELVMLGGARCYRVTLPELLAEPA